MFAAPFIQGRLAHLENRKVAVMKSLQSYGHLMPYQHRSYKIKSMLPAIETAIATIQESPEDYGICKDCGNPIPQKRLELLPEAAYCTACQSKQESAVIHA